MGIDRRNVSLQGLTLNTKGRDDREPGIDGIETAEASRKNLHWQDRKGV
ncbi:MAG: hypothetical protein OEZ41_05585 [Nitrospirota bacterium]|nr:hypothetical protein [Nitrospirota bacterium]MDH5699418.1 hypothetical protein [Nitrospirota bacterium]